MFSIYLATTLLGEYQKSIDFHQQSLAIHQEIGDRDGEAASLNNLALVYQIRGSNISISSR
ncbi:MAG: tetratricopeptide repeat protein [Okeania sp. SIO3C4]|nr:tetratricopeptide repeat protein [Okeania sp. SIO3B3]NER04790.1 tetratricopeptide repeat protein [Okeania sp. SIO3C4]